jgi:hypothetical protein
MKYSKLLILKDLSEGRKFLQARSGFKAILGAAGRAPNLIEGKLGHFEGIVS